MENKKFCFQVGQTAELQDELTGALIGLARACENNPYDASVTDIIAEGLFATITNVNLNDEIIREMTEKVRKKKYEVVPNCRVCTAKCGNTDDYDVTRIRNEADDIRSLKSLILCCIKGMAADLYHANLLGYRDNTVYDFYIKALCILSYDLNKEELLKVVTEAEEVKHKCMELRSKSNTENDEYKRQIYG